VVKLVPEQERQQAKPARRNGGCDWPAVERSMLVIVARGYAGKNYSWAPPRGK